MCKMQCDGGHRSPTCARSVTLYWLLYLARVTKRLACDSRFDSQARALQPMARPLDPSQYLVTCSERLGYPLVRCRFKQTPPGSIWNGECYSTKLHATVPIVFHGHAIQA